MVWCFFVIIHKQDRLITRGICDWVWRTSTLSWRLCSPAKFCCIESKSLCYKVTSAAVFPHSSQHLICFYSLYTHSHFTCQGGRKTYKCQGTTETTITAVCAHVWTAGAPFSRNMKITLFVTHNVLHTPCRDTWAFLSTGVGHITLNGQKSLVCHAECLVMAYMVRTRLWHACFLQNLLNIRFGSVLSSFFLYWCQSESINVKYFLWLNKAFTFYTHYSLFFLWAKAQ